MRIALLHTRIRVEERLLLDALHAGGIEVELIDTRTVTFDLANSMNWLDFDLVLDRSLSLTSSLNAVRVLESFGLRCVNPSPAIEICSDKLRTSLVLQRADVPTPRVCVAVGADAALEAVEWIGYPAVLKPTVGSWGRLMARINDRDAAEAIIEHRAMLGSVQQQVFYVQEYVDKPNRDLRVFVIGGEPVAGIVRHSEHWVTNTARGGTTQSLAITDDVDAICRRAAACAQADIVAVDLLECPTRGLLVNELNHSMEFRNSVETTGVNIPERIAQHVVALRSEQLAPPVNELDRPEVRV